MNSMRIENADDNPPLIIITDASRFDAGALLSRERNSYLGTLHLEEPRIAVHSFLYLDDVVLIDVDWDSGRLLRRTVIPLLPGHLVESTIFDTPEEDNEINMEISDYDDMPDLEIVSDDEDDWTELPSLVHDHEIEETTSLGACEVNSIALSSESTLVEVDHASSTSNVDMDYSEYLRATRVVYSSNVRRRQSSGSAQPIRDPRMQLTLTAEIEINGVKALTLFDSGSTTDSITPEFAFVTKAKQFTLDDQVVLQLGCVGSRSKISYGTKIPLRFGSISEDTYFDLVNLDRYDCILGTPFLLKHG
jgi:hypothetical protein